MDNVYVRDMGPGHTLLVSCTRLNCGGSTSLGPSSEPSLVYYDSSVRPSSTWEMCAGGERCVLVAFATADPSIAQTEEIGLDHSQVVLARAIENGDGTGLTKFDHWATASIQSRVPFVVGNASSWAPTLSPGLLELGFLSRATNLTPGTPVPTEVVEGYSHDLQSADHTRLITIAEAAPGSFAPVNANVSNLVFGGGTSRLLVGFNTAATNTGLSFPQIGPITRAYATPWSGAGVLLDRGAGTAGTIGEGSSDDVAIGRGNPAVSAFASSSGNLGAGGGSDFRRVYRRVIDPGPIDSESLELVSRPSGTGAFSPGSMQATIVASATSADGRFVAFQSNADNLSSADDDDFENVFVRDTVKGTTTLVSRANGANGVGADAPSELRGISENGQRVLFTTAADNFGFGGEHQRYAYVRDLGAQTTTLASRVNGPTGTPVLAIGSSLSGDGNRVAFITGATLDPEAANGVSNHLYVRDLAAQTTTFVDRDDGVRGEAAGAGALDSALDRKGDRVAWTTTAVLAGTGAAGPPLNRRVYLRDLNAGTTVLVSRADGADGAEANAESLAPALNAAGNVVAFESEATNLGPVSGRSIWVRHVDTNRTELVSRASGANGAPADAPSFGPSIDAAGDRVAFESNATDLGAVSGGSETPPGYEAYVRDLGAQTTQLVSRVDGAAGAPARPSPFLGAVSISGSGDCVAFTGTGLNYTDVLSGADFPQVRERVLRGNCGPASASDVQAETPAPEAEESGAQAAVLRRATVEPSRFVVGGPGSGTEISFVLDRPSRVTVSFHRVAAPTFARHAGRTAGRLVLHAHRGRNRLHFSGVLGGRALAVGRYRWSLAPLHGSPVTGSFVILRHRRR